MGHYLHLVALRRLFATHLLRGPMRGAEVGIWEAATSEILLQRYPDLFLIMVDQYLHYHESRRFARRDQAAMDEALLTASRRTQPYRERSLLIVGDSLNAARIVPATSLDWAFLDASHLYDNVWNDCIAWWPKIKPGGLLIGHDYNSKNDRRGWWGVKNAVDEWAASHSLEVMTRVGHVWAVKKETPDA